MGDAQEKSGASVSLTPQAEDKHISYHQHHSLRPMRRPEHSIFLLPLASCLSSFFMPNTALIIYYCHSFSQVEEVLKRIGTNTKVATVSNHHRHDHHPHHCDHHHHDTQGGWCGGDQQ